ncbi:hypothetical protein KJ953_03015 [Patescibacteria group bacterium]|nr:hypothetical protein [Patescibacteria group bacterium]MBU1256530.1 hypothetical protein [Patescibacteria group bacterium]MBU1457543.1 hypothetical protein [Patescibacteria group bacterium]
MQKGIPVFEDKYQEKLKDYSKTIKQKENEILVKFFENKIPSNDLIALKSSVYLCDFCSQQYE